MLKQRIWKHRCSIKEELVEAIQYEWRKVTYVEINKLVAEMEARINAILDADSLAIKY